MKKYKLASTNDRESVDLRNYSQEIANAVFDVITDCNVEVKVYKDYYTIDPPPSKGDAIRIGRKICKCSLSSYCISIRKLFCSEDFEIEEEEDEPREQKCIGGHKWDS